MDRIQLAISTAKAYGHGLIPIKYLPPHKADLPGTSRRGFCDYCNKKRPVIHQTSDHQYYICWKDEQFLREHYGNSWEEKVRTTLHKNRHQRLVKAANK